MSRHLVDPELAAALDQVPTRNFTNEPLPAIRAASRQAWLRQMAASPQVPVVEVSELFLPGPPGAPEVRALLYRPKGAPRPLPALLWIHGGGYVIGMPEMDDLANKRRVSELRCAVVSVDYRLAPETPFPGPVEDCYAALKWMFESADDIGVDPARVAVGGSSAGGGLTAALALLARDRGEIPVAFQLLISPMLDDRTGRVGEPHPHAGEVVWTAESNRFGWNALLGRTPGGEEVSCYASPARAEDLAGLPPAFICTGAIDLLMEENLEYARRLMRAGVPTELHVYPGAYHMFHRVPQAQVTQAYERDHMNALRRIFHS